MRALIAGMALAVVAFGSAQAQGQHYVRGYTRADGTYVAPHYQTNPDGNPYNNWSTQGNVNPYTGQPGYRAPQPSYTTPSPYSPPSYGYRAPAPAPLYGYTPPKPPCYGSYCPN